MQGTIDHSNYICAPAGISFLRSIGGVDGLSASVGRLLEWAVEMLTEALGTHPMPVPKSMEAPYMRVVGENALKSLRLKVTKCYYFL